MDEGARTIKTPIVRYRLTISLRLLFVNCPSQNLNLIHINNQKIATIVS